MSEATIARWNAIPQFPTNPNDEDQQKSLKRSRESDSDQDMDVDDAGADADAGGSDGYESSILSRSPSPQPPGADVGLSKYDEYVRGTTREVITVETKIKPTNKGFAMLAKLGWSEGQPVGLSGDGRVDPIPFQVKSDVTGLGKITQDVRMIETTVSQRRGMDSERQQKETEEQRRAREASVARRAALQTQISSTLKAFYCTLCDKQFQNVAQYDEHTNSYAHHHKARFKDMQASQRLKPKEDVDKRKEKERKREEKELRKIAAAAGVRVAKSTVQLPSTSSSMSVDPAPAPSVAQADVSGFRKSGWTSLSSSSTDTSFHGNVATQSGINTASGPTPPRERSDPPIQPNPMYSSGLSSAPAFRTAGWTSLDTASSHTFPWPSPPADASRFPPEPPPPPMNEPPPPPPMNEAPPPPEPPQVRHRGGWTTSPLGHHPPPPPQQPPPPPPSNTVPQSRSSWQQFKQAGPKRR